MTKQECIWWVNHLFNIAKVREWNNGHVEDAKEIETAQQMAIDALKQTAWIPVGERLPDVRGQIVMVTLKGGLVSRDFLRADGELEWYGWGDEVIAWMPLPEPYKGGDNE